MARIQCDLEETTLETDSGREVDGVVIRSSFEACPRCASHTVITADSRCRNRHRWRRKACRACRHRWTTIEIIAVEPTRLLEALDRLDGAMAALHCVREALAGLGGEEPQEPVAGSQQA